jgi:GntR family transcriptional regulator
VAIDIPLRPAGEASRLTRSNEGTLHHQLYRTLSQMISSGQVKPGERLPTEAELVDTYGVSRTTARRALDELRRQGIVERQPGKGTFVLQPRLHAAIPHLHSITDEIEHLGHRAGTVLLSVDRVEADDRQAALLEVEVGQPALVVLRIRTADDRPVCLSESTFNIQRFPQLENADFGQAMYPQLERLTGVPLSRATQWLSSVAARKEVARHLRVKTGSPLLRLERAVYLEGGIPVETVDAYFHGGLYKHYNEFERLPAD